MAHAGKWSAALIGALLAAAQAGRAAQPSAADDALVPYDSGRKAGAKDGRARALKSEHDAVAERDAAAFHIRALAAAGTLRRDDRFGYVELEDLQLSPAPWEGKPVGLLSIPNHITIASDKPSGQLGTGGSALQLTASFASLGADKRKELARIEADQRAHLVAFKGIARPAQGTLYLDVEDFFDLGRIPHGSPRELSRILASPEPERFDGRARLDAAHAKLRRLKREPALHRKIEDVLLDAGELVGKTVDTVGAVWGLSVSPPNPSFRLSNELGAMDFIQVALGRLSLAELKELMRESSSAHLVAVKGRVVRAPNGVCFLDASRVVSLGSWATVWEFLNPAEEPRPRLTGQVAARLGASDTDRNRAMSGLRRKALAALAAARNDPRYEVIEIEDLLLAPRPYAGRRLAMLGVPSICQKGEPGWFCRFSNGTMAGGDLAVGLEALPTAKRQAASRWSWDKPSLVLLKAAIRQQEGKIYAEAEDFIDIGNFPPGELRLAHEVLAFVPVEALPSKLEAQERMRTSVADLKRDPACRYVRLEDLVVEPGPLVGRRIALVGVPQGLEVGGSVPVFKLGAAWSERDMVQVVMSGLPHEEQKRVLRMAFPPHAVALKATVKTAANGALYLEAESIIDFGQEWLEELNEVR